MLLALLLAVLRVRRDARPGALAPPPAESQERGAPAAEGLPAPAREVSTPGTDGVEEDAEEADPRPARPPAAAAEPPPPPPAAPGAGRLEREFEVVATLALEGIETDGVAVDRALVEAADATMHLELQLRTVEPLVPSPAPVAAAREVRRHYVRVASQQRLVQGAEVADRPAVEGAELEPTGRSPLQGAVLLFHWDPAAGAYRASFADGRPRGDPDRLAGLAEDLDLRAFAPPAGVVDGAGWSLDVAVLDGLMAPGGDLQLVPEGETQLDLLEGLWPRAAERPAGALRGSVQATALPRVRSWDRELLPIRLEARASVHAELRGEPPSRVTLDLELELDGALQWDVGASRVDSYLLETELRLVARSDQPRLLTRYAGRGSCRLRTTLQEAR